MSKKIRKDIVAIRNERKHTFDVLQRATSLLKELPKGRQKEQLLSLLRDYAINNDCSLLITPEYNISPEHKALIRDDCSGNISGLSSSLLSEDYQAALKDKNLKRMILIGKYEAALLDSVYEREMAQYPSYGAVRHSLLVHLIQERIGPQAIRRMNIADFRSFVHEYCRDDFAAYHEQEGFVKVFIRNNEQEFYDLLYSNGEHPAYIEQLIKNMHKNGSAAAFEMKYKGQIITGPGFNIDHKHPLYCPSDIKSYPETNAKPSLNLLEEGMHIFKHKFERIIEDNGVKMYEKIMMPQYCAAALDFEHKIFFDFDDPQHKVISPSPRVDNHILINKIATLVNSIEHSNSRPMSHNQFRYYNRTGRGNSRYN